MPEVRAYLRQRCRKAPGRQSIGGRRRRAGGSTTRRRVLSCRIQRRVGRPRMLIGFDAPTRGPNAAPEALQRIVREGEAMGFDYATLSDHVVIPRDIRARYPYSATGEFPAGAHGDWHEQLALAAFLAGRTTRLRLLTSVMVVPHRQPVLCAKILSTIDVLSGGRLTVGCGAGWLEEEFAVL